MTQPVCHIEMQNVILSMPSQTHLTIHPLCHSLHNSPHHSPYHILLHVAISHSITRPLPFTHPFHTQIFTHGCSHRSISNVISTDLSTYLPSAREVHPYLFIILCLPSISSVSQSSLSFICYQVAEPVAMSCNLYCLKL